MVGEDGLVITRSLNIENTSEMVIDTSGSSQEQGKGSSWYDMLIGDDNLDEFEIFDENLYIIDDGCTYCTILINWTQL